MLPQITIITPVNNRPEIWAWYEKNVSRMIRYYQQRYPVNVEVIIADDSPEPMPVTIPAKHIHTIRAPEVSVLDSFRDNLRRALEDAVGEYIFVIEDDDWHSEKYLFHYMELFAGVAAAGQANSKYYHVPSRRYHVFDMPKHASLCQTAFHRTLIGDFLEAVDESVSDCGVDIRFWRQLRAENIPFKLEQVSDLTIGIKGLSSRPLASGHKPAAGYYRKEDDQGRGVLRSWIGDTDTAEVLGIMETLGRR